MTHNTRVLTVGCLEALYSDPHAGAWEIIVVDNASADDTVGAVAARFPNVRLLRSAYNSGFAAGNNLGIVHACGRNLVLLNSDTRVPPGVLEGMAGYLLDYPSIAILSPRLVTGSGEPQAFAFGCDPTPGYLLRRGAGRLLRHAPLHDWGVTAPIVTDWVSGACMCVRRTAIDQVGLLDDRFFMYFEDNDWCLRMRQQGWSIVYNPQFAVTHLGGKSQPERGTANRIYQQSLQYFYRKHYSRLAQFGLRSALAGYNLLLGSRVW